MIEQQEASNNKRGKLKRFFKNLLQWKLLFLIAWLGLLFWIIIYLSRVFTVQTERYTFIAQQLFNGLVFTAVVVQAVIYFGQLRVMGIAINPRLRIASVEVVSLELDRTPVFIITLANEGATDAEDVAMYLKAEIRMGTGTHFIERQIVTIPAHGRREYFVRWGGPLNQSLLEDVNGGKKPLEITGSYQHGKGKPVAFCYKFYIWPWPEPRPERLPQFMPCDLVTGQNFFLTPGTGHFVTAIGHASVEVVKIAKGQITPSGNVALEKNLEQAKHSDNIDHENPN